MDEEAQIRQELATVRAFRQPILREIAAQETWLSYIKREASKYETKLFYLQRAAGCRQLAERLIGWRLGMVVIESALLLIFAFFCQIVLGLGLPVLTLAGIGVVLIGILHYVPNDAAIVERTSLFKEKRDRLLDERDKYWRILEPLKAEEKQLAAQEADLEARAIRANRQLQLQEIRSSLAQRPWKEFRGVEFEQFLKEVFEALGGSVQTTRVTGDRGADLIVTLSQCRFAIQVKGYADSVGNSAVQQAFIAKTIYKCDRCMAITNSRFTTSARADAQATDCILIDENSLTDLILGKLEVVPITANRPMQAWRQPAAP